MSDSTLKPTRRELLAGTFGVAGAMWLAACDDGGGDTDAGPGGTDAGPGGADAGPGGTDAGPGGTDAGPGDTDAGPQECNSIAYEMTNRHPVGTRHDIMVPLSDVMAAVDVTYDIQGASRHPHTVLVTAADFARIAAGERVTITSSEDMGVDLHSHDVTLFCSA
ncbi:MAG: hypothetical protein H6719_26020 [Sandaracinaceae bacterium]|nr:hypothetical protein [Sandaracinaceae bacterium]